MAVQETETVCKTCRGGGIIVQFTFPWSIALGMAQIIGDGPKEARERIADAFLKKIQENQMPCPECLGRVLEQDKQKERFKK